MLERHIDGIAKSDEVIEMEEKGLKAVERLFGTRLYQAESLKILEYQSLYLMECHEALVECHKLGAKIMGDWFAEQMWQIGFLSIWKESKAHSCPQSWIKQLMTAAYNFLSQSCRDCPTFRAPLTKYLAAITVFQMDFTKEKRLERALRWNHQAVKSFPGWETPLCLLSQLVPNNLERLSLLVRANLCRERSGEAEDHIRDLFANLSDACSSFEDKFVHLQAAIFRNVSLVDTHLQRVLDILTDWQISKGEGTQIAFISIGSILWNGHLPSFPGGAASVAFSIMTKALQQPHKPNIYPYIHVMLTFVSYITKGERVMTDMGEFVPWRDICTFLNRFPQDSWLRSAGSDTWLVEEDAMIGQRWFERVPEDSRNCHRQKIENVETFAYRRAAIYRAGSRIADVRYPLFMTI